MKKILLFNLLFFVVLMCLFLAASLGMGYVKDKRFGSDAGILFVLMVTLHLFFNYLVMHKRPGFDQKRILYASAVILCVYLLILFH